MSSELYRLPPGVNLPAKYKTTINSRRLFIDGAQDGLARRPITSEHAGGLLKQQGSTAWLAYCDGYAAGTLALLATRGKPAKTLPGAMSNEL
ncbi:MAG: hypothetical protein HZB53_19750 [Chloroflexi bacterium]|nr:hypothetical protein [Chloroflexota bacterium]